MQIIYGNKAEDMLNEQRRKVAALKPGDVGYGLSFYIPQFDPQKDALIIDDEGHWLVDHDVCEPPNNA